MPQDWYLINNNSYRLTAKVFGQIKDLGREWYD